MPKPKTYRPSATLDAVAKVGGVVAAAAICGVTYRSVSGWCAKGYVPDLRSGLALAGAARIDPASLAERTTRKTTEKP